FEKKLDFGSAPFGITGLETALPSLFHYFVREDRFGWDLVVKRYSAEPRRMLGFDAVTIEEGQPADLVIFNPERETLFTVDFMRSKSRNTPFLNKALQGHVEWVICGENVLLDRLLIEQ